ncbi:MAG: hypothetical protein ACFBSG_16560 [Leptolyngbyaceae cyanobacterium]
MTDPKLLAQAQQGKAIAIAELLNLSLQSQGVWARVESADQHLFIALEAPEVPQAAPLIRRIRTGLEQLRPRGIQAVTLQGFALGETTPAWEQHFFLRVTAAAETAALRSPPIVSQAADTTRHSRPYPTSAASKQQSSASVHQRSSSDFRHNQVRSFKPFVLKWSDFEPTMLATIAFIAIYGLLGARNPSYDGPFIWLHYPNLAIHETGHLLFMPFGHFLMVLGGSLTQIAFPAVFTGYFFYSQQYFSSALTLFWTGQNFMDVAVYMADAPYRVLPLTTPNINAHDWWQLFNWWDCLSKAELIAGITHWVGVLIYLASIVAGVYIAYLHKQTMDERHQRRQERLNGQAGGRI